MVGAWITHRGCLPPGWRWLCRVENICCVFRGYRRVIGMPRSSGLQNFAGEIHDRAAPIYGIRIDDGPCLCVDIEDPTHNWSLSRSCSQNASIRKDEHVRIIGKRKRRIEQLSPRVAQRIVDLGYWGVASRAIDLSRSN